MIVSKKDKWGGLITLLGFLSRTVSPYIGLPIMICGVAIMYWDKYEKK